MVFDFTVGKVRSLPLEVKLQMAGGRGILASSSALEGDVDYSHK